MGKVIAAITTSVDGYIVGRGSGHALRPRHALTSRPVPSITVVAILSSRTWELL
jgi:hypothetical protein